MMCCFPLVYLFIPTPLFHFFYSCLNLDLCLFLTRGTRAHVEQFYLARPDPEPPIEHRSASLGTGGILASQCGISCRTVQVVLYRSDKRAHCSLKLSKIGLLSYPWNCAFHYTFCVSVNEPWRVGLWGCVIVVAIILYSIGLSICLFTTITPVAAEIQTPSPHLYNVLPSMVYLPSYQDGVFHATRVYPPRCPSMENTLLNITWHALLQCHEAFGQPVNFGCKSERE